MPPHYSVLKFDDGVEALDWQQHTIIDAIGYHALRAPNSIIYTLLGDGEHETQNLTSADLEKSVRGLGAWLSKITTPGQRAVILCDTGIDYIQTLLGCMYAGLVPISGIYPHAFGAKERLSDIIRDSGAKIIVGTRTTLQDFQKLCADITEDTLWVPFDTARPDLEGFAARKSPDGLALIQYTSGSTRAPRGVMLTHENLAYNFYLQGKFFGYRPGDVGVNWLPLSHDMGLIGGALMALALGGRCVLIAPEHILEKPHRWLAAISQYKATHSGGPNFAYEMCVRASANMADNVKLDLSSWRVAYNGAELISKITIDRFSECFSGSGFKSNAFFACYGLAEATLFVSSSDIDNDVKFGLFSREKLERGSVAAPIDEYDIRSLAGCGKPPTGVTVKIVDRTTEEVLPAGSVGEIWISSPSVGRGYINRQLETQANFFKSPQGEKGEYLRTGDAGALVDDTLYIVGRIDNRIVFEGREIDPDDIAHTIEAAIDLITMNSVAAFVVEYDGKDELVVVVEIPMRYSKQLDAIGNDIFEEVSEKNKIHKARIYFVRPGVILKTPSGKIRIGATKSMLTKDQTLPVHSVFCSKNDEPTVKLFKISENKL